MTDPSHETLLWPRKDQTIAWTVTLIAALFFFYEFIQMNMFNSLANSFEQTFHLSALQLALVACFYFLSDTILLYPAGALSDYFSSKKLLILGMVMCILGTVLITLATNAWFLVVARFLAGTASAFCLLSILRLAAQWFPAVKMGQVTGVVVTLGMLGGAVSQTPLVWLIDALGWRNALHIVAGIGVLILLVIVIVVRDAPIQKCFALLQPAQTDQAPVGFGKGLWLIVRNVHNWWAGLYIATMNLPIMLLAGLFGTQTMQQTAGLTQSQGATVSMMVFIGTIVGSTVFGFATDWLKSRRIPMILAAVVSFLIFAVIMYVPALSYWDEIVLFFLLGLITAAQIIGYAVTRECNADSMVGSALGFVSVLIMALPTVLQPLMGWVLSDAWAGQVKDGVNWYPLVAYHHALMILLIGFVVSILCACALPETYGRKVRL
jgi:MFS family permease